MATTWKVIAQNQTTNLTPQGVFEESMEVSYQTIPEGVVGRIVVPKRLYNADYVRDAIEADVAHIKAVSEL